MTEEKEVSVVKLDAHNHDLVLKIFESANNVLTDIISKKNIEVKDRLALFYLVATSIIAGTLKSDKTDEERGKTIEILKTSSEMGLKEFGVFLGTGRDEEESTESLKKSFNCQGMTEH